MDSILQIFQTELLPTVILTLVNTAPVWLPIFLLSLFWPLWVNYVRAEFLFNQEYVLLEIRIPKEVAKSPLAMELFLTAINQTGREGNNYDKYWLGKTRPIFSLEMASIEGIVRFYIRTEKGYKNFVESSLYAQYPGIEVHEVPDYTLSVKYDKDEMEMWAADLQFTKEDAYPIKTYVDYGLDKDPKEEYKIDPIVPVLEFLGSIGANQQAWMQIIVRGYKAESKENDRLKKSTEKIIKEILIRDPKTKIAGAPTEGSSKNPVISKGEQEIVAAVERNVAKLHFETGIRIMYFAKKGFFNPGNISGLTGSWKQYNSESLNGFKPNSKNYSPAFSVPWDDITGKKKPEELARALEGYKRRSFFFSPITGESILLSTEELATIFHFPGQSSQTPTLTRIQYKKSEPPPNLPV